MGCCSARWTATLCGRSPRVRRLPAGSAGKIAPAYRGALTGANPQLDENLLRVFYALSDLTGDPRYRETADHEVRWFFEHTAVARHGSAAVG